MFRNLSEKILFFGLAAIGIVMTLYYNGVI